MGNSLKNEGGYPIFNGEYQIINQLGEGKTAHVFMVQSIKEPTKQFALKILKKTFIKKR